MTKAVNRLKVVLVEQKKTGKWLAAQLGKDPSTILFQLVCLSEVSKKRDPSIWISPEKFVVLGD